MPGTLSIVTLLYWYLHVVVVSHNTYTLLNYLLVITFRALKISMFIIKICRCWHFPFFGSTGEATSTRIAVDEVSCGFFIKDGRGYQLKSKEIHEYPWKSTDTHWNPWISMEVHEYPWVSMEIYKNPWISTELHGYTWVSMNSTDIHGDSWTSMGIYRYQCSL